MVYNNSILEFESEGLTVNIYAKNYCKNKSFYSNGAIQKYTYLSYINEQYITIHKHQPKSIRKEIRRIKKRVIKIEK